MFDRSDSSPAVCGLLLERGVEKFGGKQAQGLTPADKAKLYAKGVRWTVATPTATPVITPSKSTHDIAAIHAARDEILAAGKTSAYGALQRAADKHKVPATAVRDALWRERKRLAALKKSSAAGKSRYVVGRSHLTARTEGAA